MIAIMLCAGFGTRLHPLTKNTPKGLLEVAGRRVLDYQMPQLLDLPELEAIHLVTNGRYIAQYYAWLGRWKSELDARGITVHLHNDGSLDEESRLGAVGDLAFLLRRLEANPRVVITGGDNIYRFPLRPVAEAFLAGEESMILALREESYQVLQRYPVIEFGEGDRVAHLHEESEEPPSKWVCPTLYFLQPRALERVHHYLDEGRHDDSLAQLLDYVAQHEPVHAVRKPDTRLWLDVETRYMFQKANEVLSEEAVMVEG